MSKLKINTNPAVKDVFKNYPKSVKSKMKLLRALVLEVAAELNSITEIEETLKWGEPSYLVKKGTTIRMDWKSKTPNQYGIYFNCQSSLIPTIRTVFGGLFKYEKNRAILFDLEDIVPEKELKKCFELALTYHQIKHKPLLGM